LGCSSEELDILNFAGHLHDIGKIGIRDDILLKPGRLTAEEFEKIKEHPVIGANIVEQLGFWDRERQIIKCHHERFDGAGYPEGLKGENIPFLARILSVADVYDAKEKKAAALNYARQSLELAQKYGLKEQISDSNLKLSTLFEKYGSRYRGYITQCRYE